MRLLPCGDLAVLVELEGRDERRRLDAALRTSPLPGSVEHVPADHTVLVRAATAADLQRVVDGLRSLTVPDAVPDPAQLQPIVIPVRYDGPDLAVVAEHLNVSPDEVIARHTGALWRVEFAGFAPGFGYLTTDDTDLTVPRRDQARTRIPAGSVGLAGAYSGVYPSASPGGWQLIGSTELAMWDPTREEPALLAPGRTVRFEEIR
ncbi:MAG TPA: allophanate hydrolase subunit 1 [Marmoricola sp.]